MSPIMIRCSQVTMIKIAVVEHQRDPAWIGPFLPIFGDGDAGIEAVHLHRAVAGDGDADAVGEAEFRADGIGNRRAHRRQIAAAAGHHAAADFQIAGKPVGRRAAVGRNDAAIGQLLDSVPRRPVRD